MQDNFSIRSWKNETVHKEEYDAGAAKVKEQDELEADDIELEIPGDESTATVDKTVQAKATKQDQVIQAYKDITAKMKDTLEKYKAADGDDKEAAKEELKTLTPEFQAAKKAYEKLKGVKL
jgi:uncharacterized phage infection (PIP) family protein YhgE